MWYSELVETEKYRAYIKRRKLIYAALSVAILAASCTAFYFLSRPSEFITDAMSQLGGALAGIILIRIFTWNVIFDRTWYGRVVYAREVVKPFQTGTDGNTQYAYRVVVVRDDDGKVFTHSFREATQPTIYFKEGDEVRHISSMKLYEKKDKRGDTDILCCRCGQFSDIREQTCVKCGHPLLK